MARSALKTVFPLLLSQPHTDRQVHNSRLGRTSHPAEAGRETKERPHGRRPGSGKPSEQTLEGGRPLAPHLPTRNNNATRFMVSLKHWAKPFTWIILLRGFTQVCSGLAYHLYSHSSFSLGWVNISQPILPPAKLISAKLWVRVQPSLTCLPNLLTLDSKQLLAPRKLLHPFAEWRFPMLPERLVLQVVPKKSFMIRWVWKMWHSESLRFTIP